MRLVKQKVQLNLLNFDKYTGSGLTVVRKHSQLLPNSVRCIISGPSGSGKTNVAFNLLFDPNGLRFENVYVFSKSLYQEKYKFLEKAMPKEVGFFPFSDNTQVLHPSEAKPNSVMIFDDIASQKQNFNVTLYFSQGRHNNLDVFYLGQTYSHIPKQLIRDNANIIVLFKQDDMNLKHVYSDHVNTDMEFAKFKELCSNAWKNKHGFIVISKEDEVDKGRYRVGFDSFITDIQDARR